jgi:3-deoxy-alpha-D-manno-octulosonate 8-oxidase
MFDQIIMDQELLASVPKDQFFYTAMDCYVHDVESLRGSQIDAMSKACAEKSLELVRSAMLGGGDPGELMVASYFGGLAVANSNVGICHPLSYGLSTVLGLHHGEAICAAFEQLEEYYGPFVREFRDIRERLGVKIPQGLAKRATPEQIDIMAAAALKNEKPLANAFGPDWRAVFSPEKVKTLLLRI